jgi:hypothetical protein
MPEPAHLYDEAKTSIIDRSWHALGGMERI